MATVFDSPFLRQRLHRFRHSDAEYIDDDQRFGRCDCTSYSYFALSMVLFSVGTVITVLALGDIDGFIFNNLGHLWLIGPLFMCSGLMVAVKSMLYLRRKSVIQMLLQQRAIFRTLAAAQAAENVYTGSSSAGNHRLVDRLSSTGTLPPSYDIVGGASGSEVPPPSYEEAMLFIEQSEAVGKSTETDAKL